ncbi:gliding motility-associated C-terminal domain-containing protein [uncultured Kriegella sp.]|uniref:T9SS type B sorting domain-containing protein n=1 Tax=uncultured Kriegella sp. TaxID=1798910 RepID=UPI0030D7ED2F|tara:strand:- start:22142 stop:25843 length:3702 start_codon:yes stop_codon:yes gene_type:complete
MKLKRNYFSLAPGDNSLYKRFIFAAALLSGLMLQGQLVSVNATVATASETGTSGTFRISITGGLPGSFYSVGYIISGTATQGDDYASIYAPAASGTVFLFTGAAGNDFEDITVGGIVNDNLVEGTESVVLNLSPSFAYTIAGTGEATVSITDNDTGVISLDTVSANFIDEVNEDGSGTFSYGQFRIVLDNPNGTASPVTVNYTISGTASGTDYNLTNAVDLTFNNTTGQLARNIRVAPVDDAVAEPDETVTITLNSTSNPVLFSIGTPASATITIIDDDCAAGDTAPAVSTNAEAFCDTFSQALDDYFIGVRPANTDLGWTTNPDPSVQGDWLPPANGSPVTVPGVYYAFFVDNTTYDCFSPTAAVTITQSFSPSAGTTTDAGACSDEDFGESRVDLDDHIDDEDDGDWTQTGGPSVGAIPGNNRIDFDGRATGQYIFTYTTNTATGACVNDTATVTVTVIECCDAGSTGPQLIANPPATVYCDAFPDALSLSDFTTSVPPAGTVLKWTTDSADPADVSSHLTNTRINNPLPGTYYALFYDADNDCTSPLLEVTLALNETPTITGTEGGTRCGPGEVELTVTATGSPTFNWYTSETGGTPVDTGASYTPTVSQGVNLEPRNHSFWVEATENGCPSPRVEVIATVVPQPSPGIPSDTSSCNDSRFGTTTLNLAGQLAGEDAGVWAVTSQPAGGSLGSPTNGTGTVDFQGQPDGDYVFTFSTTGAQAPCANESSMVTVSVSSCDTDNDGDGLFGGDEQALGTDPNNPDTDGDGVNDGVEVGDIIAAPLDEDNDGIIDALDSNITDLDNDGVNDQQDPANDNPCVPDNSHNLCDTDGDGITDGDEEANGSDPLNPCDPNLTPDCEPDPIDLEIIKEVDNENALVGERVTFTIHANNLSDSRVLGVKIGDLLETGFEYIAHTASLGSYDPETGIWDVFEMQPLANITLEVTVDVLEGGVYTNTAELLDSFPIDNNSTNDVSMVTLNIDLPEGINLIVEKTARINNSENTVNVSSRVSPLIGEEVIFTIKVTNKSQEDAVSRIVVRDSITNSDELNFTILDAFTVNGTYNENSNVWVIESLAVGEEALLEISMVFEEIGTLFNTATIENSSPHESKVNDEDSQSTIQIEVSERTPLEIGIIFNQFSPNGDGTNDELKINRIDSETNEVVEIIYSIKIFNRYGALVFEGDDMTEEVIWDGSWEGQDAPDGTYFYVLDVVQDRDDVAPFKTQKGWIQLIR